MTSVLGQVQASTPVYASQISDGQVQYTTPVYPGGGSGASPTAPCAPANTSPLGATAIIEIGTIIGTQTSLPSATAPVNKFLGVPFAKSPPTRFMPAVAAAPLTAPFDTKAWKPACIQQFVCKFLSSWYADGCLWLLRSGDCSRVCRGCL